MLTGAASQGGLSSKQGWQLIIDKYNAAGGLKVGNDTYKLTLDVEDDAMSTDQAATSMTKLLQQNNDKIVLSSLIDSLKVVEYPLTSKAGALLVATDGVSVSAAFPYADNADVNSSKPLFIRTQHAYTDIIPGLLDYLKANYPNVKTIAINGVTESTTPVIASAAVNEMTKRGFTQVGDVEQWAPDISDYTPVMTRILANKPDAIFVVLGGPVALGGEVKVARELGFTGPIFTTIKCDVQLQANMAGTNTSDIFVASITLSDPALPQAIQDVKTLYLQKYPADQFISDVVGAYNGLWVLLQTIEKSGSLDPQTIQTTYEGMTADGSLQTVYGSAKVGGLKTLGVNRAIVEPVAISAVKDGKAVAATWVTYELP